MSRTTPMNGSSPMRSATVTSSPGSLTRQQLIASLTASSSSPMRPVSLSSLQSNLTGVSGSQQQQWSGKVMPAAAVKVTSKVAIGLNGHGNGVGIKRHATSSIPPTSNSSAPLTVTFSNSNSIVSPPTKLKKNMTRTSLVAASASAARPSSASSASSFTSPITHLNQKSSPMKRLHNSVRPNVTSRSPAGPSSPIRTMAFQEEKTSLPPTSPASIVDDDMIFDDEADEHERPSTAPESMPGLIDDHQKFQPSNHDRLKLNGFVSSMARPTPTLAPTTAAFLSHSSTTSLMPIPERPEISDIDDALLQPRRRRIVTIESPSLSSPKLIPSQLQSPPPPSVPYPITGVPIVPIVASTPIAIATTSAPPLPSSPPAFKSSLVSPTAASIPTPLASPTSPGAPQSNVSYATAVSGVSPTSPTGSSHPLSPGAPSPAPSKPISRLRIHKPPSSVAAAVAAAPSDSSRSSTPSPSRSSSSSEPSKSTSSADSSPRQSQLQQTQPQPARRTPPLPTPASPAAPSKPPLKSTAAIVASALKVASFPMETLDDQDPFAVPPSPNSTNSTPRTVKQQQQPPPKQNGPPPPIPPYQPEGNPNDEPRSTDSPSPASKNSSKAGEPPLDPLSLLPPPLVLTAAKPSASPSPISSHAKTVVSNFSSNLDLLNNFEYAVNGVFSMQVARKLTESEARRELHHQAIPSRKRVMSEFKPHFSWLHIPETNVMDMETESTRSSKYMPSEVAGEFYETDGYIVASLPYNQVRGQTTQVLCSIFNLMGQQLLNQQYLGGMGIIEEDRSEVEEEDDDDHAQFLDEGDRSHMDGEPQSQHQHQPHQMNRRRHDQGGRGHEIDQEMKYPDENGEHKQQGSGGVIQIYSSPDILPLVSPMDDVSDSESVSRSAGAGAAGAAKRDRLKHLQLVIDEPKSVIDLIGPDSESEDDRKEYSHPNHLPRLDSNVKFDPILSSSHPAANIRDSPEPALPFDHQRRPSLNPRLSVSDLNKEERPRPKKKFSMKNCCVIC